MRSAPRRLLSLLAIPALAAGMAAPSAAQTGEPTDVGETRDIPSVGVLPTNTASTDPNAGQWFVAALSPGQTGRLEARVHNPAAVDQQVHLSLADLDFGNDGTPVVADVSDDLGTWGAFDQPLITVPAGQTVVAGFSVTAPDGVEPGDHVGVVVAESEPQGSGAIKVVKRVATRIYVTVPGDAQPAFEIEQISMARDSGFWTREVTFTVVLRNTGRVRLLPNVTVNGREARGSELLMSRSVEPYVVAVPVRFWGGPLQFKVEATTSTPNLREGPARTMRASMFVVPWLLFILLLAAGSVVYSLRLIWVRRSGKYAALRAEVRRLERLVATQLRTPEHHPVVDPNEAIRTAMKRAVRAGDTETEERLKVKLAAYENGSAGNGSQGRARIRATGGHGKVPPHGAKGRRRRRGTPGSRGAQERSDT